MKRRPTNDVPNPPEFPIIDGKEIYFSPKVDGAGEPAGFEWLPVPDDVHGRLMASRAQEELLRMLTKQRIF